LHSQNQQTPYHRDVSPSITQAPIAVTPQSAAIMRQSILLAAFSAISAVAAQANFTVDPATVDGGKRSM